jgi:alanine racemase
MNRNFIEKKNWTTVIAFLKRKEHVFFKGLCTHYAGAEIIANYYRVDKQIKRFEDIYQYLCKMS